MKEADEIKALFNTSGSSFRSPGGGEILLWKTKEFLEKKGLQVELFKEGKTSFGGFDLFHNFNIHRDCYPAVKAAKDAGLPVAVSTIYWPSLKFALLGAASLKGKFMAAASRLSNKFNPFSAARKIVNSADLLLPNSLAEAEILKKEFGASEENISVIPNAVDRGYLGEPGLFEEKSGLKDFVLYVGRIEPRKNVFSLIKAVNETSLELAIIGEAAHFSKDYEKKCRGIAGKNIHFFGAMGHETELLKSAFAAAKVFALPSWYETPGLAALEAGLNHCNVVVTSEGCAKEYFREHALYANPESVREIREKIVLASEKEKNKNLSAFIKSEFSWENAAEKTIEAYKKII